MNPIHILMVEDNMGDVLLIREALKMNAEIKCEILHFTDGDTALKYLLDSDAADRPKPVDLIFLDINLPKKSGLSILQEIRANTTIRHLPVVMFSSSESDDDINDSYFHLANCYITKPVRFDELIDTIGSTIRFWGSVAKLPNRKLQRSSKAL